MKWIVIFVVHPYSAVNPESSNLERLQSRQSTLKSLRPWALPAQPDRVIKTWATSRALHILQAGAGKDGVEIPSLLSF